jgi:hypothetical protein
MGGRVGALPRPDIPPGGQRDLVDALHALHHTAGWPSLRYLAREVGVSPTTVSGVFSAPRLPSWGLLSLVVEALQGDVEEFHRLWFAASTPDGTADGTSDGVASATAAIAGRRAELAAVRRHLESGTGLLLVTGEAGIGKTKLVDTARATCGVFVATGAGLPLSVEVPFLPLTHALLEVLHAEDTDWVPRALAACPAYVPGALAPLLPELTTDQGPPGLDDSARPRPFNAIAALLLALADRRPLALLIDDLHWADANTLDLLEHLLATGVGVPLLGTLRTDDPAVPDQVAAWSARVRRRANVETLELSPLSRAETAEQIGLLHVPGARGARATDTVIDRIYARSLGQPLFTEQLSVHPDGPLPRLLDDVLGQRVAALPSDEHLVVTALGVADRALSVDLLQAAIGLSRAPLTDTLHALARRRLLGDGLDTVALRHPLLAEAVRRRLVPGEATEMHRMLAATLAETGEPAEVAAHWQGAGDAEQELVWRIRAARVAHDRIAAHEAARQWQRALELWPDGDLEERDGVRRIDAVIAQLDALEDSGHTERAWTLLVPLLERVDALPPLTAAEILCRASAYGDLVSGAIAALEYAARAVALFETAPSSRGMVRALTEYAQCLQWAGRVPEALEVDRRLVAVCRSLGEAVELRSALVTNAAHLSDLGWSTGVRALLDEARRIETPQPDPAGEVFLGVVETDLVLRFGGGPVALLDAGSDGLAAAEKWHIDTYRALSLRANVALGLLRAGRVAEAAELVDPHTEGPPHVDAWVLDAVRVGLDTVRGRLDEARARLEGLVSVAAAVSEDREITAVVTTCDLWAGRPDLALERLSRALGSEVGSFDQVLTGECQVLAVRAAADLADAGVALRPQLQRRVARLLSGEDPTDFTSEPQHAYQAARTAELARLAADSRPDRWVSAAKEWDAIGRPFESAYARWRGAQAALTTGHGTLANRLLQRAARDAHDHMPLTQAIRATNQHLARTP